MGTAITVAGTFHHEREKSTTKFTLACLIFDNFN